MTSPFSYAHVCLIEGEQGSGKSVTGTGRLVDKSIKHIVAIERYSDHSKIDAEALTKEEKFDLVSKGYQVPFNTVKLNFPDGRQIIRPIPSDYLIVPGIRIFTNFHLFGIKYVYCRNIGMIVELLDHEVIRDGLLSIDEYQMQGNARESMTGLGKALSQQSFTYRKRHLDVDIMCAHKRLADWTSRLIVSDHISCHLEDMEKPNMVTLDIKLKGKPTKTVTYDASIYWPFYLTDEIFKLRRELYENAVAEGR